MTDAVGGYVLSDIPIGTKLCGRYAIVRHLADGAIASVYQARDTRTGGTVALKILDPLRGTDPVGRARFEREFEVVRGVSHPGVARSLSLERDGDLDVLVLEYVEGMSLGERIARGRIEQIEEVIRIGRRLADALAACHEAGVLHRDLKPENVVLHPEQGPVIVDFGLAWFSAAANLTKTGALIGSPQYLAPELFGSSFADARTEVYALGAILFEMLTGRPVRLGATVAELAGKSADAPPLVSVFRSAGEVPLWLDEVVARATAPRPEDRFATMRELADALRDETAGAPRGLKARTRCRNCKMPLVVEMPFCAGCGRTVSWGVRPGPFGIQILAVDDVERCAKWLEVRHGVHLKARGARLRARLRHPPIPVALGISEETAEQILAEAKDVGCKADVVRARAIFGTGVKAGAATVSETVVFSLAHVFSVGALAGLATWLVLLPIGSRWLMFFLPVLVSLLGVVAATLYMRRSLFRTPKAEKAAEEKVDRVAEITAQLGKIRTERARGLAAGAVLRAAPALVDAAEGGALAESVRADILEGLRQALEACADVDTHAVYLQSRPRARLSASIEGAKVRVERGEEGAAAELEALEQQKTEILEASVAHDLSVRQALESAQHISASFSCR